MNDSLSPSAPQHSVKGRLLELLKFKRMSQTEFARQLGVSPTYVGAMRKSLPNDKLKRVLEIFPDLNRDWLLFGDGEMLVPIDDGDARDRHEEYVVPLLPVQAFAGHLQDWSEGVMLRDCEKIVSPVPGAEMAIRISGDSMEPTFHSGATLLIKRINEKAFIPWGHAMVIDTENGVLVKALYPVRPSADQEEELVEARSFNPQYPPILIPTSSIYSLYRILTQILPYSTF